MASIIQKTKALSATADPILFSSENPLRRSFLSPLKKKNPQENQFNLLHSFIFTHKVRQHRRRGQGKKRLWGIIIHIIFNNDDFLTWDRLLQFQNTQDIPHISLLLSGNYFSLFSWRNMQEGNKTEVCLNYFSLWILYSPRRQCCSWRAGICTNSWLLH